ncbi:MAG: SDR family oxidoreductase [Candidatus Aminicenantes bacterium]|nr:SDR family oxidoreductase [Candidatus Aminicenantes bacterium]
MALYLVTGGAGFIGSNIVEELLKQGERVRVLDNFSTGRRENLAPFMNVIELQEGDLRDPAMVRKAVDGVDYVLHLGALASVSRSVKDPVSSNETNVAGTLNLLMCSKDASVKRVVYASSSSVYGDTPTLPKIETIPPNPYSPYAVSKLAGEYYCRVFHSVYGLETVCLRYFNIFGPRQNPDSQYAAVIPLFIKSMLKNERPTIFGDGSQSRDFTYVANVVEANLLAIKAIHAPGRVFNIACGARYSLLELVDKLNRILGTALTPRHAQTRIGDVKHSLADVSMAGQFLGYTPSVEFEEGLRRTVAWNRMNIQ